MMKDLLRAIIEANNANEEREAFFEECGKTEEFDRETNELQEAFPEWTQFVGALLNSCMPGDRVHPVISAFEILPESIARNTVKRMDLAHAIVMRQINEILKKRFESKPAEEEPKNEQV